MQHKFLGIKKPTKTVGFLLFSDFISQQIAYLEQTNLKLLKDHHQST